MLLDFTYPRSRCLACVPRRDELSDTPRHHACVALNTFLLANLSWDHEGCISLVLSPTSTIEECKSSNFVKVATATSTAFLACQSFACLSTLGTIIVKKCWPRHFFLFKCYSQVSGQDVSESINKEYNDIVCVSNIVSGFRKADRSLRRFYRSSNVTAL